MTTTAQPDAQVRDLQAENDLLLRQLHQVQEALERTYLEHQAKGTATKTPAPTVQGKPATVLGWDDHAPTQLADIQRLQALAEAQRQVHALQLSQSLNAKLGDLLIAAADHPLRILGLPFTLLGLWRRWGRTTPPAALGGTSFSTVIARYGQGGLAAVETLLTEQACSPLISAQALTALARSLHDRDRAAAAVIARRAFACDPKPYRLKWLAFRIDDAGDPIAAEALLDVLPPGTPFSESESRQASQVRHTAQQARLRQAQRDAGLTARRKAHEDRLAALTRERDQQAGLVTTQAAELQTSATTRKHLDDQVAALTQELVVQQANAGRLRQVELECKQAEDRAAAASAQLARLQEASAVLEQQAAGQQAQLQALTQDKALLAQSHAHLDAERAALAQRLTQAEAAQRGQADRLEALTATRIGLEADKAALTARLQAIEQFAVERKDHHEALTTARIEAERAQLNERLAQADVRIKGRDKEIETLKALRTRLETDQTTRNQEVDALKKTQARLEQEKAAAASKAQESDRLAAERLKVVNDLQQKLAGSQAAEAELTLRQQQMQEEIARAETQIGVIQGLLLPETVA